MMNFKKITSVALATAMMLSVASFSSSAAVKKAVNSENTAKGVKISWKETKKAGNYQVLRSTSKNKGFKIIGSTKNTTFTDKKTKKGKTYYYTVKATKAKASYKTEKAIRLTAPTLKKVVAQETGNLVTVKWSKVKGAKVYSVYYAKVKANGKVGKYEEYFTVDGTNTDVYLKKEGTYSFKIAAVNGSSKSTFSNVKKIDFVPTPNKATEFTYELAAEEERIVENLVFDEDVTISGDFGIIVFENCEFNGDIISTAEQFTRVILSGSTVNGNCVFKNTIKEASMDYPMPKFISSNPLNVVCEDCIGSYILDGIEENFTFNGETYSIADVEFFYNANTNELIPYEQQEVSTIFIGQWWENGEKVLQLFCE